MFGPTSFPYRNFTTSSKVDDTTLEDLVATFKRLDELRPKVYATEEGRAFLREMAAKEKPPRIEPGELLAPSWSSFLQWAEDFEDDPLSEDFILRIDAGGKTLLVDDDRMAYLVDQNLLEGTVSVDVGSVTLYPPVESSGQSFDIETDDPLPPPEGDADWW